ncbi:uncharacterized protein LOC130648064 [Hydractinia symbiolongicarpus]|uniref:uncharacterized protein LOC130648064 n=1 Tax=Hydractinia symbiolongicarpus TaxID=13093 RepID=UPI00254E3BF4|nr:uncharacterized protein LOC130648064 [Hydractinia symbiolongicarpus]
MLIIFAVLLQCMISNAEDCGPIGYDAKDLLSPSYWYFDLPPKDCPPIPEPDLIFLNSTDANNSTCRIYFNLCQSMYFQCAGSVCVNYLNTEDYINFLGETVSHPFHENHDAKGFRAQYPGQYLQCKNGRKKVTTTFVFTCDKSKVWNRNVRKQHGGSEAPKPDLVLFNNNTCEYTVSFNYSGACLKLSPGDSRTKNISTGSFILILFFPAVVLYFLLGILINRVRGHTGKDMIPQREFWSDLPELIMDGFAFTMATVTCHSEDRSKNEYTSVD